MKGVLLAALPEYAGDMLAPSMRFPCIAILAVLAVRAPLTRAEQPRATATPIAPLVIAGLGKGTVALDGPWQFHLGDDTAWASPDFDDSGWEQLSADRPWGQQGHASYSGYAWYRKAIQIAPGTHSEFSQISLLIPHVDNTYELYWNGVLVGRDGRLPPHPITYEESSPPRTFLIPATQHGVLALRMWKAPPLSDDSGRGGGLTGVPMAGRDEAISSLQALEDYRWLRSQELYFTVNLLYGLVALLSLLAWLQDRKQWPLFWMFGFALAPVLEMLFYGARLPWPAALANSLWQPITSLRDICLWFLLIWLLDLRDSRPLMRLTWVCIWVSMATQLLDSAPYFLSWIPAWTVPLQVLDAVLTAFWIPTSALPVVLVAAAARRRRRLSKANWVVAIFAFSTGMMQMVRTLAPQGGRFTHSMLADKIEAPLFTLAGNAVSLPTLAGTLLLIAIVYAVYRNVDEARRRQSGMEQEFKSARELQRVLVPETTPAVAGYSLTSAYLPAEEVGGDFFQIIPLEGSAAGSTLVVVGDVSGKGLKAAMAVSFIVGTLRALASLFADPARLLVELNRRLAGRLQGGFTTCLILRLDADGACVMASAGHPSVFLNSQQVEMAGSFPLGIVPSAEYDDTAIELKPGDHCTLYTDGLLEARSKSGELYGFERLENLLRTRPDATEAADAAVRFGQDDDITIVTLTRTEAPTKEAYRQERASSRRETLDEISGEEIVA